jgi:hypothetical protein
LTINIDVQKRQLSHHQNSSLNVEVMPDVRCPLLQVRDTFLGTLVENFFGRSRDHTSNTSHFNCHLPAENVMDILPENIPNLPDHIEGLQWSANVSRAHSILADAYSHGLKALDASDNDVHRLWSHSDRIIHRILPILRAMEPEVMNQAWAESAAESLASLVVQRT